MQAGFLTASATSTSPDSTILTTATSLSNVLRAPSGSTAAVGGEDAIFRAGGRGGIRNGSLQSEQESGRGLQESFGELRLSLPGTGALLKLLTAARSHLIFLIMKAKSRKMPLYLLHERWDGGNGSVARAKKNRSGSVGNLPSRTRKWREFYGLAFDWILAECLGAGLVEICETGSVGRAVRIP